MIIYIMKSTKVQTLGAALARSILYCMLHTCTCMYNNIHVLKKLKKKSGGKRFRGITEKKKKKKEKR